MVDWHKEYYFQKVAAYQNKHFYMNILEGR